MDDGLPDVSVNASVRVVELSKVDTREELGDDLARKPRYLTATMFVGNEGHVVECWLTLITGCKTIVME